MPEDSKTKPDGNTRYHQYRPKMFTRRTPIFWWTQKKSYVVFILRELTSLFVAAYAVIVIWQVSALRQGPEAFEALMSFFATPFSVVLHSIIFAAVVFHSITWFKLAPSAMVLKLGSKPIPGRLIIAGNIFMWIILSAGIAWLILSA